MTEIYPCARHSHLVRSAGEPGSGMTLERAADCVETCPDCEVTR